MGGGHQKGEAGKAGEKENSSYGSEKERNTRSIKSTGDTAFFSQSLWLVIMQQHIIMTTCQGYK